MWSISHTTLLAMENIRFYSKRDFEIYLDTVFASTLRQPIISLYLEILGFQLRLDSFSFFK